MDKYGVQYDDELAKTAATGKKCPKCGGPVAQNNPADPPYCVKCGTEPWEKKPEVKK